MSNEKDCPFCNVDERRNLVVEENENAYVTLSNPRKMKGHLLVIPKRHVEKIENLSDAEWKSIVDLVVKYHAKIIKKISQGCDFRQHYVPYIKQNSFKVDHVHFHLMPRDLGDAFQEKTKQETELFEDLGKDEANEVLEILK